MLEDDNADRRDEPSAGNVEMGEVKDGCNLDSEDTGVSEMEGVSCRRGPWLDAAPTFVLICNGAVPELDG